MIDNYWKKRKAQCGDLEQLDLTPLAIPIDCKQPETTNEAIARILYQSGQITLDAYQSMRGMEFDMPYEDDEDFDFEDYDDDIVQSSFAQYEDEIAARDATKSVTDSNAASVAPEETPAAKMENLEAEPKSLDDKQNIT